MSNTTIDMILRYFIVEAKQSKINNGKYGLWIIFQQATSNKQSKINSGLYYPPQTNQEIFKYQYET